MKYLSILGRQPALGVAELERLYPDGDVRWFSDQTALCDSDDFDFNRLGGSQKAGKVVADFAHSDWRQVSQQIVKVYSNTWSSHENKITLGISAHGFDKLSPRDVQKTGIILKKKLKEHGVSLRLIPNTETILNSATSHHNKLGLSDNKVEILIVRNTKGAVIVAESIGAQNITSLARRDQERPKRDAFVGMLPPKLAKIMVNLTGIQKGAILDPFCGTGVLLQEAMLLGFDAHGSDLSEKMVRYSEANLQWFQENFPVTDTSFVIEMGDATTHQWPIPIDAVATEAYLGQPFSAPPSETKLREVRGNCDHIIRGFLKNIAQQLSPDTPLCIAVPAWKSADGSFTHLPLTRDIESLGFKRVQFANVSPKDLLYHREDQIVARELLVVIKK